MLEKFEFHDSLERSRTLTSCITRYRLHIALSSERSEAWKWSGYSTKEHPSDISGRKRETEQEKSSELASGGWANVPGCWTATTSRLWDLHSNFESVLLKRL